MWHQEGAPENNATRLMLDGLAVVAEATAIQHSSVHQCRTECCRCKAFCGPLLRIRRDEASIIGCGMVSRRYSQACWPLKYTHQDRRIYPRRNTPRLSRNRDRRSHVALTVHIYP